ncbi:uncharacterized protein LOC117077663 isoform X2 [Trachypithecus francoisi]|uniref:uncharacterized protein LOC117077663 isoform X2 n=1 Tax=Trachypithecus francoisi TaxID=54180 RepID=UPI00141AE844|nr:uncharacterized protein LOC117077663 isoform X2 [Trachypithecus francoisi]
MSVSRRAARQAKRTAAAFPPLGLLALRLPAGGGGPSATSGFHQSLLSPPQSPPSFRSAASCPERGLLFLPNTAPSSPPGSHAHHTAWSPGGAIGSDSASSQIQSSWCHSSPRNPVAPSSPVSGPLGSHPHLLSPPALSAFHLLGIRLAAAPRPHRSPTPPRAQSLALMDLFFTPNMSFLFLKGFGVGPEKFTVDDAISLYDLWNICNHPEGKTYVMKMEEETIEILCVLWSYRFAADHTIPGVLLLTPSYEEMPET